MQFQSEFSCLTVEFFTLNMKEQKEKIFRQMFEYLELIEENEELKEVVEYEKSI